MKKINLLLCFLPLTTLCSVSCSNGGEATKTTYEFKYKLRKENADAENEDEKIIFSNEGIFSINLSDFVTKKTNELNKSILDFNTMLLDDMYGGGTQGGVFIEKKGEYTYDYPGTNLMHYIECQNIKTFDLNDYDFEEDECDLQIFDICNKVITYNSKNYQLYFVVLHGTSSAFDAANDIDVGYNNENYVNSSTPHNDWKNKNNHKGFDVSANRCFPIIANYINETKKSDAEVIVDLIGHSKGGAVSNILGTMFADGTTYKTFTYTYASPCITSLKESNYSSIFNIVNSDDFVANIFTDEQGFYRYGTTLALSAMSYKSDIDNFYNNKFDYAAPDLEPIHELMSELFKKRSDIYTFDDSNKDEKTFESNEDAIESRDLAIDLISKLNKKYSKCLKVGEISYDETEKEYSYEYSYTPSIMLNLVASFIRGDILDVSLPLLSYCGSYIKTCLAYVPSILANGTSCFMKAHLMAGYKAVSDHLGIE